MASLEAARTHRVAKASWMLRQSGFLGRTWKPHFCVLYRNGTFSYYKDENRHEEQGTINVAKNCAINAGAEVKTTAPPEGKDVHCLLELRTQQANMMFCTDSIDDSQAWKSAIVEVKNAYTHPAGPPAVAAPPAGVAPPPYMVPPPAVAPPPYTVTHVAPPAQQILVNPGGSTTTYTTYRAPSNQYVIPPANQTVVVNRQNVIHTRRAYPVQNMVYAYPGQACTYTTCQLDVRTTPVEPVGVNGSLLYSATVWHEDMATDNQHVVWFQIANYVASTPMNTAVVYHRF